jgi:hypothetical protein
VRAGVNPAAPSKTKISTGQALIKKKEYRRDKETINPRFRQQNNRPAKNVAGPVPWRTTADKHNRVVIRTDVLNPFPAATTPQFHAGSKRVGSRLAILNTSLFSLI